MMSEQQQQCKIDSRTKKIRYGKVTLGYQNYVICIPKNKRDSSLCQSEHPVTPNIYQTKASKRGFDGQVKKWRRLLHLWDIPNGMCYIKYKESQLQQQQDGGEDYIHVGNIIVTQDTQQRDLFVGMHS